MINREREREKPIWKCKLCNSQSYFFIISKTLITCICMYLWMKVPLLWVWENVNVSLSESWISKTSVCLTALNYFFLSDVTVYIWVGYDSCRCCKNGSLDWDISWLSSVPVMQMLTHSFQMGWMSGVWFPARQGIFLCSTSSRLTLGLPNLLYSGYLGLFPQG
jgi:hypothetical protein